MPFNYYIMKGTHIYQQKKSSKIRQYEKQENKKTS